jgi:hypothetical protein
MVKSLCQKNRQAVANGPMNTGAEKLNIRSTEKYLPLCSSLNVHRTKNVPTTNYSTNHLCFILLNVPKVSGKCLQVLYLPTFSFVRLAMVTCE